MNENSRKRTPRNDRKKLLVLLLVAGPLCAIGAVLFLNNRDLIVSSVESFLPKTAGSLPSSIGRSDTTGVDMLPAARPAASAATRSTEKSGISVEKITAAPSAPPPSSSKAAPVKNRGERPDRDSALNDSCCSVLLAPIACSVENRKDMVINLSLELFFNDIEERPSILLRREDIKMMALRTMREQQLSAIKIHELETELQRNIACVFRDTGLIRVTIRNIQIEKAAP